MNLRDSRVQIIVGCLVIVILGVAVYKATQKPSAPPSPVQVGPQQTAQQNPPPAEQGVQVDVIEQVAATTGKVIHAKQSGREILTYTCKPEDAAIAVFTIRDRTSGANVAPAIMGAADPQGRDYIAYIEPLGGGGPAQLLTLKRGFQVKPSSVTVTLGDGSGKAQGTIKFTEIAEPIRYVSSSSVQPGAEKIARAEIDEHGGIAVKQVETLPADQHDEITLLDSSYMPINVPSGDFPWTLTKNYQDCLDAVRVRIDRMGTVGANIALHYKSAKIVEANGKGFVWFPQKEVIGTVEGHKITLSNELPRPNEKTVAKTEPGNEEVDLKWIYDDPPKSNGPIAGGIGAGVSADAPSVDLVGVSPSLETFGLHAMRVDLRSADFAHGSIRGFDQNMESGPKVPPPTIGTLQEVVFSIYEKKTDKISSRTIVLPVHRSSPTGPVSPQKGR